MEKPPRKREKGTPPAARTTSNDYQRVSALHALLKKRVRQMGPTPTLAATAASPSTELLRCAPVA